MSQRFQPGETGKKDFASWETGPLRLGPSRYTHTETYKRLKVVLSFFSSPVLTSSDITRFKCNLMSSPGSRVLPISLSTLHKGDRTEDRKSWGRQSSSITATFSLKSFSFHFGENLPCNEHINKLSQKIASGIGVL